MLTEPHQSRIGAIQELPVNPRRRKRRTKKLIEIGGVYECNTTKISEAWKYPFLGIVEKIYNNSALVRIVSTRETDDWLVSELKNRTVVPLKSLYVREEMS